ncbi:hypothetical protein [Burkholderia plantarii]|nr:hypothetical protein [Burkholderia plantarii]
MVHRRIPWSRGEQFCNLTSFKQGVGAVSYTHLDVYKRQALPLGTRTR